MFFMGYISASMVGVRKPFAAKTLGFGRNGLPLFCEFSGFFRKKEYAIWPVIVTFNIATIQA